MPESIRVFKKKTCVRRQDIDLGDFVTTESFIISTAHVLVQTTNLSST